MISPNSPVKPLDDLSDRAIHFMMWAKKNGCAWVHPAMLDEGEIARELLDAGIIRLHPCPVRAVYWIWE